MNETLYSHNAVSPESIVSSVSLIEYERARHRYEIGKRITDAVYKGWLPYCMEFWEGTYDDHSILRDHPPGYDDGMYHFYTKMKFAALQDMLLVERGTRRLLATGDEAGTTFTRFSPERLS